MNGAKECVVSPSVGSNSPADIAGVVTFLVSAMMGGQRGGKAYEVWTSVTSLTGT
jgi:hypothetical protein